MSEPIRTSAAKRKQLAAALKRNMVRRKNVGHEESRMLTPTPHLHPPAAPLHEHGDAAAGDSAPVAISKASA